MNLDDLITEEFNHLQNNQPPLEYIMDLDVGLLAQVYCLNHKDRPRCGHLIMHQIEEIIRKEAEYQAKQRLAGEKDAEGIR